MADNEEDNKCILCGKNDGNDLQTIKTIAIANIVKTAKERNDLRWKTFEKLNEAHAHKSCRSRYGRRSSMESAAKLNSEKIIEGRKINTEAKQFDFSTNCFFCGKIIPGSNEQYREVKSENTGVKVIENAKKKNQSDPFIKSLLARINCVEKLTDVHAKYHVKCMTNFYTETSHDRVGRPLSVETSEFMKYCVQFIENQSSECQFSLNEIKRNFNGPIPLDLGTIKKKLNEHFDGGLEFSVVHGDLIIVFSKSGCKKINKEWYENRLTDPQEERNRIVRMAAHICLEDTRAKIYDRNNYDVLDSSEENLFKLVPDTLAEFTNIFVKTHKDVSKKKMI